MKILKSRNRGYGREPAWIGSVPMLEFSGFPSLPVLARLFARREERLGERRSG